MINKIIRAISKKLYDEFEYKIYIDNKKVNTKYPCFFIVHVDSIAQNYGGIEFSTSYILDILYKTDDKNEKEKTHDVFSRLRNILKDLNIDDKNYSIKEEGTYFNEENRHFFIKIVVPNTKGIVKKTSGFYEKIINVIKEISQLEVYFLNGDFNISNIEKGFFILRPTEYLDERVSVRDNRKYTRTFDLIFIERLSDLDTYSWLEQIAQHLERITIETENGNIFFIQSKITIDYQYGEDDDLGTIATYKLEVITIEE